MPFLSLPEQLLIWFPQVDGALSVRRALFALRAHGGRAARAPSVSYWVVCTVLSSKQY